MEIILGKVIGPGHFFSSFARSVAEVTQMHARLQDASNDANNRLAVFAICSSGPKRPEFPPLGAKIGPNPGLITWNNGTRLLASAIPPGHGMSVFAGDVPEIEHNLFVNKR